MSKCKWGCPPEGIVGDVNITGGTHGVAVPDLAARMQALQAGSQVTNQLDGLSGVAPSNSNGGGRSI